MDNASMTGRYSGFAPAITALAATISTLNSQASWAERDAWCPQSHSGLWLVPLSILATLSSRGKYYGKPVGPAVFLKEIYQGPLECLAPTAVAADPHQESGFLFFSSPAGLSAQRQTPQQSVCQSTDPCPLRIDYTTQVPAGYRMRNKGKPLLRHSLFPGDGLHQFLNL